MGLKFLRDGVDSANTVTMYQAKGQYKEWNFFEHTLSNHVFPSGGDLKGKPVLYKSSFYTDYVYQTGTSDMAKFDAQGNKESNVVFPFRLEFEPNASVKSRFSNSQPADAMNYINDLKSIPSGSVVYHMYGWTAPPQIGGKRVLIGDLKLQSKMVTSKFGDTEYYVRHQYLDEDIKAKPEWKPYYESYKLGGKCPYEKMLQELRLY